MLPKKYLIFGVAIVFALVLFYSTTKKISGFQNTVSTDSSDIKIQMCEIFRDTYNSLSSTLLKMDKSKIKVSDTMTTHLDSIKKQMEKHGC
jgi:DNA replication protein DnaD